MDALPNPMPGTASSEGIWTLLAACRFRDAVLSCLHFLTCRICDPPPEVSDSARLAMAGVIFGASAAMLAATAWSRTVALLYFAFGVARLLPACKRSLAVVGLVMAMAWPVLLFLPEPMVLPGPILLAALAELCWLVTMRKVLDDEFDVFVAVLFLFLGVELTFGFYPLLMEWGPRLLANKEVHETVQVVVTHAVHAGHSSAASPGQPSNMGGNSASSTGEEEEGGMGFLIVFSQFLPLLLLLIGVPALAFAALISCWMFEHMSRMVLAVTVSFFSWMALYVCLVLLRVPVSRDTFGKAVLGSACVLMYHAFSRLTSTDEAAAQLRLNWLGGSFAAIFVVDQLLAVVSWQSPLLLFAVLLACKLAYSTWANYLEADCRGAVLQPDHLVPFKVGGPRREPILRESREAEANVDHAEEHRTEERSARDRPNFI